MALTNAWKDVVGYEGKYIISNRGEVKNSKKNKMMKPQRGRGGYYSTHLSNNGIRKHYFIHRLVAYAFIGPQPQGEEINHKDGNKKNNCVENLEWCTRKENIRHAFAMGLIKPFRGMKGEEHPQSKLTVRVIKDIRQRYAEGEIAQWRLGKEFFVGQDVISRIVNYKTWKHI